MGCLHYGSAGDAASEADLVAGVLPSPDKQQILGERKLAKAGELTLAEAGFKRLLG
jgi:hypothetical protein